MVIYQLLNLDKILMGGGVVSFFLQDQQVPPLVQDKPAIVLCIVQYNNICTHITYIVYKVS